MSDIKIDLSLLRSSESEFKGEASNFDGKTKATFDSSYIKSCPNNVVQRMASNLNSLYETIHNGYQNIDTWWNDYNNRVEELESSLAGNSLYEFKPDLQFANLNNLVSDYSLTKANLSNAIAREKFLHNWTTASKEAMNTKHLENIGKTNGEPIFISPKEQTIKSATSHLWEGEEANGETPYGRFFSEEYAKTNGTINNHEYDAGEWCAMFVVYNAYKSGVSKETIPQEAYVPYFHDKFVEQGVYHPIDEVKNNTYKPEFGDVIFYNDYSHTGLVVGYENGQVSTIEGNTGSYDNPIVKPKTFDPVAQGIEGFAHPNYEEKIINPNLEIKHNN